jgi:SAM-dependent methyltransferase
MTKSRASPITSSVSSTDTTPGAAPAFQVIDGIRCYAPERAFEEVDYPSAGFDVSRRVEDASFWCRSRNRLIGSLVSRYVGSGPARMLELGCGIGGVLTELVKHPNLSLTGSEIYLHGLRYARTRLPQIDFIQLDATTMDFVAAFDVIGAFDVLEHIEADEIAMARVHDALTPNGLFFITVPQYPSMWSRLDELVHHKRRYTRVELASKLAAADFDVLFVTSFVCALFPVMLASRLWPRRPQREDESKQFQNEVQLPGVLNTLFDGVMRIDEAAVRAGWSLPFGGTLVAVARRAGV